MKVLFLLPKGRNMRLSRDDLRLQCKFQLNSLNVDHFLSDGFNCFQKQDVYNSEKWAFLRRRRRVSATDDVSRHAEGHLNSL